MTKLCINYTPWLPSLHQESLYRRASICECQTHDKPNIFVVEMFHIPSVINNMLRMT